MFPKVMKESDAWDGPGNQNDSKPKKILYIHYLPRVLGSFILGPRAWIFFLSFLLPSAFCRIGEIPR